MANVTLAALPTDSLTQQMKRSTSCQLFAARISVAYEFRPYYIVDPKARTIYKFFNLNYLSLLI